MGKSSSREEHCFMEKKEEVGRDWIYCVII